MKTLTKICLIISLSLLIISTETAVALEPGYYSSELVEGLDLYWTHTIDYEISGPKTTVLLENYKIEIDQNMSDVLITNVTLSSYLSMYMNGTPYDPLTIARDLWNFILPLQIVIDSSTYSIKTYFEFIFAGFDVISVKEEDGNIVVLYTFETINSNGIVDIIVDKDTGIVEYYQKYTHEVAGTVSMYFYDKIVYEGELNVTETSGLNLQIWISLPFLFIRGYYMMKNLIK